MEHGQDLRVITRHSEPTKLDTANYLTLCMVHAGHNLSDYYIQFSHDQENPKWEYLGEIDDNAKEAFLKLIQMLK